MMHDLSTNIADNPHWEIQGREQWHEAKGEARVLTGPTGDLWLYCFTCEELLLWLQEETRRVASLVPSWPGSVPASPSPTLERQHGEKGKQFQLAVWPKQRLKLGEPLFPLLENGDNNTYLSVMEIKGDYPCSVRPQRRAQQTLKIAVSLSGMPDSLWRMDDSPPGSSVHGILQAGILKWGAIPFSRWSSQPGD